MKVLVTGVTGFVGSHVAQQLLADGHDVVGVGSLTHNGASYRVLEAIRDEHASSSFTWMRHDLAAPFSNEQRRFIGELDAIINVASLASVDQSIKDPVGFVQNNVNSTLNVLELARTTLVSQRAQYVQMSTDEVYGEFVPCDDRDHTPSSPYAASKAAQEDLCNAWQQTFDVPVSIIRASNMFGERQSELAFIPRIVRAVIEQRVLSIHVDQNGKPGTRNYTYVGNVARYLAELATHEGTPTFSTTLRGQMSLDNFSLALNVAAVLDRELVYEFVDASTVRPGYDHAYALFGTDWSPQISAGEALRRTVVDTARRMGADA